MTNLLWNYVLLCAGFYISICYKYCNLYLGNTNLAYGHTNQMNSNITNLKIQDILEKKIHVGDIDIAYKRWTRIDVSVSRTI